MSLLDDLRQRRHHRAFRIGPPPGAAGLAAELTRILGDVPEPAAPARLDDRLLADAATNLWRAARRLDRDGTPPTARERQARRYLTTCRDALTDAGLVVQDHDGDPFHPGRSIEVLVFQDDPALTGEVVVETVRPTVYLHGRRIQTGQVIVAGPPATGPPSDPEGNHHGRQ